MSIVNEDIKQILVLGPEGTYLDGLAKNIAPNHLEIEYPVDRMGGHNFPAVIDAIHNTPRAAGLIVIANTLSGALSPNVGAFQNGSLRVEATMELNVVSNIMGCGTLEEARCVGGKDVALDQIKDFMAEHDLDRVEMESTAAAGKHIKETGDRTMLAIGSLEQARIYGLDVLARGVQDSVGLNLTTVLLARSRNGWELDPDTIDHDEQLSGTMIIRPNDSDKVGALHRVTGEIVERDINLIEIESLCIRGTKLKEFFVTFSGVGRAIADLVTSKQAAKQMKLDILGVYDEPLTYDS